MEVSQRLEKLGVRLPKSRLQRRRDRCLEYGVDAITRRELFSNASLDKTGFRFYTFSNSDDDGMSRHRFMNT